MSDVVITGIGMITPLGQRVGEVLHAVQAGESAARPCERWAAGSFACPVQAPIRGFDPDPFVPEPKTVRLMSRDALLAVAAARRAMEDAAIEVGNEYAPEDVGLYGATGMAGIDLSEVSRLIQLAADNAGGLDLHRFGEVALKQVRPVLSFKILSNMPLCFVSIFLRLQGPNAIYNPWEGQGAQAIAAASAAIRRGEVPCALAGGCDVKTHELAFLAMARLGVFESWERHGSGSVPGEGAAFLVLEDRARAEGRGARIHARLGAYARRTVEAEAQRGETYGALLAMMDVASISAIVRAGDGDRTMDEAEDAALASAGIGSIEAIRPKRCVGNLFAAAAAVQVGLAAAWAGERGSGAEVLAACFGHGSEQAAFILEGR